MRELVTLARWRGYMSAVEQMPMAQIDLKVAVMLAKRYMHEVSEETPGDLRLEEVERDREVGAWRITLSYDIPITPTLANPTPNNALSALLGGNRPDRAYRIISLDQSNGEFLSMKLRKL